MPDRPKQKIMVVDDDPAIRESMTAFLHANGYELSSATDGYDALWLLKNGLVNIVISDLEIPGLSGFEFLSILRQRYPEISVIAMTGRPEGRSKLATAIADAFYPKGQQHPKRLLSMIAELLRDSTIRTRVQEAESSAVRITDNRSDTGSTPDVLVTSPECLKSFSIEAQRGKRLDGGTRSALCFLWRQIGRGHCLFQFRKVHWPRRQHEAPVRVWHGQRLRLD
jgi:CheY-like chemotaxis protein